MLEAGEVIECKKGKVLCRDGDKSTALYILLVGRLLVRTGEVNLSSVDPVDIVGEMGVITGMPRSATVEAEDNVRLLVISKVDFDALLSTNEGLAVVIYKSTIASLCQKLRDNNANLVRAQLQASYEIAASSI